MFSIIPLLQEYRWQELAGKGRHTIVNILVEYSENCRIYPLHLSCTGRKPSTHCAKYYYSASFNQHLKQRKTKTGFLCYACMEESATMKTSKGNHRYANWCPIYDSRNHPPTCNSTKYKNETEIWTASEQSLCRSAAVLTLNSTDTYFTKRTRWKRSCCHTWIQAACC